MKKKILLTLFIAITVFISSALIIPQTVSANKSDVPYLDITVKDLGGNVVNVARVTLIPPTGYATRTVDVTDGIAGFSMVNYPSGTYIIQAWNPIPPSDNRSGSKSFSYTSGKAITDITLNIIY